MIYSPHLSIFFMLAHIIEKINLTDTIIRVNINIDDIAIKAFNSKVFEM